MLEVEAATDERRYSPCDIQQILTCHHGFERLHKFALTLVCKVVVKVLLGHNQGEAVDASVADAPEDEAHASQAAHVESGELIGKHSLHACLVGSWPVLHESPHGLLYNRCPVLHENSLSHGCSKHIGFF